jgi:hypothetical protein
MHFIRVLTYEFIVYSFTFRLYRTTLNYNGGISFNMFPVHSYEKLLFRKGGREQYREEIGSNGYKHDGSRP